MAKVKIKNLDKAIDSIFSRYNSNLRKAMEHASKQAEEDINWEAKSCLYRYYDNYEPNWYDRTDSLIQAFVPINELTIKNDEIVAKVGIMYDPEKLEGVYYTEASQKDFFNPVDATWVLKNYLAGIHPRTNGYPIYGAGLVYDPFVDPESPDATMKEYIQKYKEQGLSKDEFELLLRMTYEEEWELYKLVKYWRDKNE